MDIDLHIFEDDQELTEICKKYWGISEDDAFIFEMSEISFAHNISTYEIITLVKKYSIAYSRHIKCSSCNKPYYYNNRQDFSSQNNKQGWICPDCKKANEVSWMRQKKSQTRQRTTYQTL